ncbi:uncharacterized protein yc1106_01709 [Curvularia clavata]|uniref:Uncharacterized protein n=1 Tax=Curvularia clavata TaxID=95742 RepID=A0A9Q8Z3F9_CURCL|nr:uncharacterized protein yc1106_01709 [Curvularia clavata]
MPISLHPLLKPLTADDLYLCPEDDIEEAPVEYRDPEQRAAKRRRVEAIAARYIRGQPPVILTAGLRGPFNNGWKNPWAKPTREKQETAPASHAKLKRRSRIYSTDSPETARAARDIDLSAREHEDSLSDIEVPPPTAPLSDEDGAYTAAGSKTWTRRPSRSTSPVWLRRPESPRVRMPSATNEHLNSSPTRSRSRNVCSQAESVSELRISFPKGPVELQMNVPEGTPPDGWNSSASASMDISSAAHGDDSARSGMDYPAQPICTPYSTEQAQRSQRVVPIVTSSMGSQTTVSRDDVQRSAERLIDLRSASSKLSQRSNRKARKTPRPTTQDDLVSPLPASLASTHQTTGQTKQARNKATKPKPRVVNFDSSPEKTWPAAKQGNRKAAPVEKPADEDEEGQSTVVPQSAKRATEVSTHEGELQKSHTSRESDWCTQAALVRAQLEFQQSTFPTLSPATLQAESPVSLDSRRAILDGPSPAATPLATPCVPRNEALANDGVSRGPPISTQDLFGAASPFTFSTVKKKGEGSQGSNLRLGMGAGDVGASFKLGDAMNNSPTPQTGRIPLKDKNTTTTSFWSFVSEKASQGSQGCLGERSRWSAKETEFAPLRLDASVDDFGRHFTGSFVRGINEG